MNTNYDLVLANILLINDVKLAQYFFNFQTDNNFVQCIFFEQVNEKAINFKYI